MDYQFFEHIVDKLYLKCFIRIMMLLNIIFELIETKRIFRSISEASDFETHHKLLSFFVNPIAPPMILPFSCS